MKEFILQCCAFSLAFATTLIPKENQWKACHSNSKHSNYSVTMRIIKVVKGVTWFIFPVVCRNQTASSWGSILTIKQSKIRIGVMTPSKVNDTVSWKTNWLVSVVTSTATRTQNPEGHSKQRNNTHYCIAMTTTCWHVKTPGPLLHILNGNNEAHFGQNITFLTSCLHAPMYGIYHIEIQCIAQFPCSKINKTLEMPARSFQSDVWLCRV